MTYSIRPHRGLRHVSFGLLLMLAPVLAGASTPEAVSGGEDLQLRHGHPYLFFTTEDVAKLKQRISTDRVTEANYGHILATADEEAAKTSGTGGNSMEPLCLAYGMTHDVKYSRRIREILVAMAQQKNFSDPAQLERDPPWHSGLGTGATVYTFAIGFDAIHDSLNIDERKSLATALTEKGTRLIMNDWVLGGTRIHSLDTMGHNWWSAIVYNAGIGSIAVMDEEPDARPWLRKINEASIEWMNYAGSTLETKPATFDREGGFYESVGYGDFAENQFLRFRLAWNNAFKTPAADLPLIEKLGDFFCNVSYDLHGGMVSIFFGDGNLHATGRDSVVLAWANGVHKPAYAWFLKKFETAGSQDHVSPIQLTYGPTEAELNGAPSTPGLPVSMLYPDMGWATMRSSWGENATLLGVKSGFTWNHSHADAGSFILFHGGDQLLVDSGGTSYSSPEYDGYYRQSRAHNVVLFNGQAQNPEDTYFGSQFPGSISHMLDAGHLKYLFADATGPTAWRFVRNFRHVVWVGDVILIIDDVKSFEPGQFEWTLHVDGKVQPKDLDLQVSGEKASVLVRPLFPETFPGRAGLPSDYPEKMRLVERSGFRDHDSKSPDTYYSFVPPELTRRTKFMVAITLVNDANRINLPKIERLQTLDMDGVRIHQNGLVTELYLNLLADGSIRHRNANATINGWETDAYMMAFTFPEGSDTADFDAATELLMVDGSYLRKNGTVMIDSLSKVYMTERRTAGNLDVLLQGQPDINATLRAKARPDTIRVNGKVVTPPYDSKTNSFTVRQLTEPTKAVMADKP